MSAKAAQIEEIAGELGLSMVAKFVPWSLSRNAGESRPSLNWKVTLLRKGKAFLETDYMAGMGHAPSYKQGKLSVDEDAAIRRECEKGRNRLGAVIEPKLADVLHSLVNDGEAIDSGDFAEWASNYGYDTDSRKAEAIYRACLEIGLKLRSELGDSGLAKLREALQDY